MEKELCLWVDRLLDSETEALFRHDAVLCIEVYLTLDGVKGSPCSDTLAPTLTELDGLGSQK